MLKKFFISMLGTIAGFWISLLLIVGVCVVVVSSIVASADTSSQKVAKNSILRLDLSGSMPEANAEANVWQMLRNGDTDADALVDILDAIRLAKSDSKIEGIYIDASGSQAGFASREEIVAALRDFKTSGKWIYAYSDGYSQADYLVASVADSVYLNPIGAVDIHGMAMQTPFFKGLLDKIGVKMQVVRVGTFKSAVEPYVVSEMSPAARLQTQVFLDSIWGYTTSTIASARGVSCEAVNAWADTLLSCAAARGAVDAKAVSALKYQRQVEDILRRQVGLEDGDELSFVSPAEYMSAQKSVSSNKPHIAVYIAAGDIVDSGEGGIVGDKVVPDILELADDDNVKALVLRVNSGGGSAFASEQIWEALEYFKAKGKKFYVSMGDYAASGGYYISCGADRIFADHTTLTGSIGVFGLIPDFSGLVTDKLGVTFSTVETNPNAVFISTVSPLSDYQKQRLQQNVERTYDLFTSRVAQGRGIEQDSVKLIAEGRVWAGGSALALGLVDRIGGLNDAVAAIADEVDLDTDCVVYYPSSSDRLLAKVIAEAKKNVSAGSIQLDAKAVDLLQFLNMIRTANPVQARMMPFDIE